MGKPNSSDCLTLNVVSGQWERGMFTNGLLEDGVQGVINLDGEGIFVAVMWIVTKLELDMLQPHTAGARKIGPPTHESEPVARTEMPML